MLLCNVGNYSEIITKGLFWRDSSFKRRESFSEIQIYPFVSKKNLIK